MSADLLTEAAALMRSRARGATPGPWKPYTVGRRGDGNYVIADDLTGVAMHYALTWTPTDAEHIAGMHPAVALAVADWLEAQAERVEIGFCGKVGDQALAVARAYLGRDA